jgi:hypothetical protein
MILCCLLPEATILSLVIKPPHPDAPANLVCAKPSLDVQYDQHPCLLFHCQIQRDPNLTASSEEPSRLKPALPSPLLQTIVNHLPEYHSNKQKMPMEGQ